MTKRARARAARAARAMETLMRVVGDKEGKGGKAMATASDRQVDCDSNKEGNCNKNQIRGCSTTMTQDHNHNGDNNHDGHCLTQQSTVGMS